MPVVTVTPDDLAPFATIEVVKAIAMIDDAMARAARVAPCILDATLSEVNATAAKAVIRDAILRRNDAGTGAVQQQTAGPFSQLLDNRQPQRTMFWPSEIAELQAICADHNETPQSGAFAIDTAPYAFSAHLPWCSYSLGANYCTCGVDIAGTPIYELG